MRLLDERTSNQFGCLVTIEPKPGKSRIQSTSAAITVKATGRLFLERKDGRKDTKAVGGTIHLRDNAGLASLNCNGDRRVELKFNHSVEPEVAQERLIAELIDKLCNNDHVKSARRG